MRPLYPLGFAIAAVTVVMAVSPSLQALPLREDRFDADDYVVPVEQRVAGRSQGFYANDWWQWVMAAPTGENPQDDPLGRACARDQGADVWYLAGSISGDRRRRTCSIPAGRHLFFPVISVYDTTAPSRPMTCADLRGSTAHVTDRPISLEVKLNGVELANPQAHRITPAKCFDLTARIPSSAGVGPMFPSATDGYWMMLRPLPPGRHTISFRAGRAQGDSAFAEVMQDVTYTLTVLPEQPQEPQQ